MPKTVLALLLTIASATAQETHETPPVLRAADILRPEYLSGSGFRVLDNVSTFAGRNRYTVETPWGYLHADGDALLMARVAEVRAIAELENVSRSEEFKVGLKAAAKAPVQAVAGVTGPLAIAITGRATPLVRAELEKRGITLLTGALPGPQK